MKQALNLVIPKETQATFEANGIDIPSNGATRESVFALMNGIFAEDMKIQKNILSPFIKKKNIGIELEENQVHDKEICNSIGLSSQKNRK